jgi:2-iminoacetate synthase
MTHDPTAFLDEALLHRTLEQAAAPDPARVREVLARASEKRGLGLAEAAVLLQARGEAEHEAILEAARRVKLEIYGRRLVLFAPLYLSNYCSNNCLYCGFRRDNRDLKRRRLAPEEIRREVELLTAQGHKRIMILAGEDPSRSGLEYLLEALAAAYSVRTGGGHGAIRRINVEVAPLEVEEFRRLKAAAIGTYVLFQETYHRATYAKVHPAGPKSDYAWRLLAMDRAQQGGVDDVGIGALFGLYDHRFEVLGLLRHAQHLDETFGVGPHTISVPRIEPAQNAPLTERVPHPVSDREFARLVAVLRLAVPYTGIILTTRETAALRDDLMDIGVSQISAGSRTHPGGYSGGSLMEDAQQFSLADTRTLDEVVRAICARGYVPSFCTACYRQGRTGREFMDLAKPGLIHEFCLPNALLTFQEYLTDYASPETRAVGEAVLDRQALEIEPEPLRRSFLERLARVRAGERDLYL